ILGGADIRRGSALVPGDACLHPHAAPSSRARRDIGACDCVLSSTSPCSLTLAAGEPKRLFATEFKWTAEASRLADMAWRPLD
nr:hypothetical protein [Tanacetum cinerariifolium]